MKPLLRSGVNCCCCSWAYRQRVNVTWRYRQNFTKAETEILKAKNPKRAYSMVQEINTTEMQYLGIKTLSFKGGQTLLFAYTTAIMNL